MITWAEVYKIVSVQLGTILVLLGVFWAVGKPHFQRQVLTTNKDQADTFAKQVLGALKDNSGEYRKWNDLLYAEWRAEQVRTSRIADETHEELFRHAQAFDEHKRVVQESLSKLSNMPVALEHLAQAVNRIANLVQDLGKNDQLQDNDITMIKTRLDVPSKRGSRS